MLQVQQITMSASIKVFYFVEDFPLSSCKTFPPTLTMVHLLHRLYGVDAFAVISDMDI